MHGLGHGDAEILLLGTTDDDVAAGQPLVVVGPGVLVSKSHAAVAESVAQSGESGFLPAGFAQQRHFEVETLGQQLVDGGAEQVRALVEFPAVVPDDQGSLAAGPARSSVRLTGAAPVLGKVVSRQGFAFQPHAQYFAAWRQALGNLPRHRLGHPVQKGGDGLKVQVAVVGRIENHAVGGHGADDAGEAEVEIKFLFGTERIRQLIFVHIQQDGHPIQRRRQQAAQVSHIDKTGDKNQVQGLIGLGIETVCVPGGGPPHAPFPEPAGQSQAVYTVPGAGFQTSAEGTVGSRIIGLEEDNVFYVQARQPLKNIRHLLSRPQITSKNPPY